MRGIALMSGLLFLGLVLGGCVDDDEEDDQKGPSMGGPVAGFRADCHRLLCTFTDASEPGDAPIDSYQWDLGDGNTSMDEVIEHEYEVSEHDFGSDVTYVVDLAATDENGLSDTTSREVSVRLCFIPGEQEREHPDDVLCDGEYALVDPGSGRSWDGPVWEEGYWWLYDTDIPCPAEDPYPNNRYVLHVIDLDVIESTEPDWQMPVYRLESRSSGGSIPGQGCGIGDDWDNVHDLESPVSRENLGWVTPESGLTNQLLMLPLQDGKRWVHLVWGLVEVESVFVGSHQVSGNTYDSTWRVTFDIPDEGTDVIYYDEEVGWWIETRTDRENNSENFLLDWYGS